MTSLTDVYDGDVGSVADPRRRTLGTALFLVGAAIVVAAIAVATTGLREVFGLGLYEAREVAGLLAGVGLPAVFIGIFAVLPAGRAVRAAAAIGFSLALLGVSLFAYAYPDRWLSVDPLLTVSAILLYSLGTLTTVWCLFAALATFKTRNDPGGTARMEITEEGTIRIIESAADRSSGGIPGFGGFGSVGLFGQDPDGNVETQTNRPRHAADGGTGVASAPDDGGTEVFRSGGSGGSGSAGGSSSAGSASTSSVGGSSNPQKPHPNATSDGGAEVMDSGVDAVSAHASPDEYCGNCTHFEYVRVDGEMVPYCGFHEGLMEDMDACADWMANR